ncbi:GMC oxidoreductase [Bombardia bombarda]|uniref:GMC oxidoreductase n=1 Tax=Bombardia bombarda TaxID=252184 RepID=A0AA40CF56_9PEZI|nr:GMC oxidoreductase [Bombardia bombarda]
MGLYTKLPDDLDEVDVIIAGGGTAGCIVAGRLAAADPDLSILLIEWGADNYNNPIVANPVFFSSNFVPENKTAIFYQSTRQPQLANRDPIVHSGGTLGGGSSINLMLYTRAQRADFDSWQTPGWSADEMVPFLKRLETYHPPGANPKYHGFSGPVHISDGGYRCKTSEDQFINAARELGYPEITDLQDLDTNDGFQRWFRNVSPEGRRQDTAYCYVHPLLQDGNHPNLHVLVQHKVVRVLFDDNKRACAVEFTPNTDFQVITPLTQTQPSKRVVAARKLVVVSSGACGSPGVLERSGVGSREVLERAGVPVVADVPGVGHDYQDHNLNLIPYKTALGHNETGDDIVSGRISIQEAIDTKHQLLGWNLTDVSSKIRMREDEVAAFGPEFKAAWDRDFRDSPNKPDMLIGLISTYLGDQTLIPEGRYVTIAPYTAYPYSRGHIHITGPDVTNPLDFNVGFFTDAHDLDLKKLHWAYKKSRELMRRTDFYRGEVPSGHPRFPPGSKAGCFDLDQPVSAAGEPIKDLEYSAEDDAAIEQYLREVTNTTWHSLGTCKMAPWDEMGVLDAELNVYGVTGLKVVDLAVAPENVAANTNNTAMVIGERGADIIARELGIVLSADGKLV